MGQIQEIGKDRMERDKLVGGDCTLKLRWSCYWLVSD